MKGPFVLSIRTRLTLGYAMVVGLLLLACGGLLFGVVRYQLMRHHDPSLRDTAARVEAILSRSEDCAHLDSSQIEDLNRQDHLILFHEVGREGQTFYRSPNAKDVPSPASIGAIATATPFETFQEGALTLRVHSRPYQTLTGRQGLIRVMEPMGDVEEPLHALRVALLFLIPVAILVAALGGYWMAGRALSPVDRITKQAQAIEAQSLASRLPHPGKADELGRLVDTLNQMFGRLERAFEGMQRFTSDASHELRSPLAIMRSTIDVALDQPRTQEEYRTSLESLGEEVDHLRKISSDLLLLARADAGRMALERGPVRLDRLVSELVEVYLPMAQERSLALVGEIPPDPVSVLGDERWLRQALANLVDNGLKFTPSGGRVELALALEADSALISVVDSGPGIPAEQLPRIFERFFQGDPARTRGTHQGSGLGLSIAAWIVEAHGGIISAENRSDASGSCFVIRLPFQSL